MMLKFVRTMRWTSALAVFGSLLACGGGGGGGDSPAPVAQAPRVVLTSANAPTLTAEALQASLAGGASAGGATGGTAAPPPAAMRAGAAKALAALKQTTYQATSSETVQCGGGGSLTTTVTTAGTTFAVGDTITLAFNACSEGGTTSNGTLTMRLVAVSGTATSPVLVYDIAVSDFDNTSGSLSERTNGTLRMTLDLSNLNVIAATTTSDRIAVEQRVNGVLRASRSLTAMALRNIVDINAGLDTATVAFVATGDFPRLGASAVSFQVETLQALVTGAADVHPRAGQIKITAANNATILATVQATGMLLEIDRDGNGTVDETRNLTWAEVDALLVS
jgi:hypothetical protein